MKIDDQTWLGWFEKYGYNKNNLLKRKSKKSKKNLELCDRLLK